MKKEELLELGLTNEQATAVFKMRGLEIEESKATLAAIQAEKDEAEATKAALEAEVEQLKNNGVDEETLANLKADKEALEAKLTEITGAHEAEINQIKLDNMIDLKLRESGARELDFVRMKLDKDSIKLENGELKGLNEQLETVKNNYDFLFQETKTSVDTKPVVVTSASTGAGRTKVDPFKAAADRIIGK